MKTTLIFVLSVSAILLGLYFCQIATGTVRDLDLIRVFFIDSTFKEVEHG